MRMSSRSKPKAVGRINPETGELEFQGSNKEWIPTGVKMGSKGELARPVTPPKPVPVDPMEEAIRRAMCGLNELRAGSDE